MKNGKIRLIVALLTLLDSHYYKKAPVPVGTDVIRDVPYAPDGSHWHRMDIIRPLPLKQTGKLPVIVNIHGGGWIYGDKDSYYRYYCMNLAKCGYAVVSMNYRLATEVSYPGQIEDLFCVLDDLCEHGAEYGMDLEHVFLVGDSAGANIAGIAGLILKNPAVREQYLSSVSVRRYLERKNPAVIRAMGFSCGVYSFDTLLGDDVKFACRPEVLSCVFGRTDFRNHPLYGYTDILKYLTGDYFPLYVMGSESDTLYPETEKLIRVLEQLGIPRKVRVWEKKEKLPHVFHLKESSPHQAEVRQEMLEFFSRFL